MMTIGRKTAVAAVAVAALGVGGVVTAGGPAGASDRIAVGARGNTVIQLYGPVTNMLQRSECGPLTATTNGGAKAALTGKNGNKLQLTLPVTGVVVDPDNGKVRLTHGGAVELANGCYDVTFQKFYIQNFGDSDQFSDAEVTARNKQDADRDMLFDLSLANAQFTFTPHGAAKIRSANLYLGQDGADDFNAFVGGGSDDESSPMPFHAGDPAGNARTTVRIAYASTPPGGDA